MFSTTAVLNACQARNDSGSLSFSFAGLVTFNPYDRSTFYAFDARGYTDYPTYAAAEAFGGAA
jgi:hypothetical protein